MLNVVGEQEQCIMTLWFYRDVMIAVANYDGGLSGVGLR